MSPRILTMHPPNFAAINRAFNVRGQRVIFAYGDAIYNPERWDFPEAIFKHECVHLERQAANGPRSWWQAYIANPAFRLAEELPAHQAEYCHWAALLSHGPLLEDHLAEIAARLASPLYGGLIGVERAQKLIHEGVAG